MESQMSKILEIPDDLYEALRESADAQGVSPVDWIAARLGRDADVLTSGEGRTAGSLAERFAGRVGRIRSGGTERLSEADGEAFVDYLESKRQAGRL